MDGDETVANDNLKLEQNNTSASTDTVSTASNSVYPESNKQQNKYYIYIYNFLIKFNIHTNKNLGGGGGGQLPPPLQTRPCV